MYRKKLVIIFVMCFLFASFFNYYTPVSKAEEIIPSSAPLATTEPATNITDSSAIIYGNLTSDGGKFCKLWFEFGKNIPYQTKYFDEFNVHSLLDEGDGESDYQDLNLMGDDSSNDKLKSSFEFIPSFSGEITSIGINIVWNVIDAGEDISADIRIASGNADSTWGEGTLVKEDWIAPDGGKKGWFYINLDTFYQVTAGNKYEIEFITVDTTDDLDPDQIAIANDRDSTGEIVYWGEWGGANDWSYEYYGDINFNISSYNSSDQISKELTGLQSNTEYHYRIVAENKDGIYYGSDQSFYVRGPPTINTQSPTSISSEAATLNGLVLNDGMENCSVWFEWGENEDYGSITTKQHNKSTGYSLSEEISPLQPKKTYHFRMVSENSYGTTYGSDKSFTTHSSPPSVMTNPPIDLGIDNATLSGNLTHDGGEECEVWFEWGETESYGEITPIRYAETGEIFTEKIIGLEPGKYHCRAVAQNSNTTVYGLDVEFERLTPPTVYFYPVTNITTTQATLRAYLEDGGENCTARFWYMKNSTMINTTDQIVQSGEFMERITSLTPGTVYYCGGYANNTAGDADSITRSFITKPYSPSNLTITSYSNSSINLEWDKGEGANTTVLVRKKGNFPVNVYDGTIVYNGTGNSFSDINFSEYTSQYYRAWSYQEGTNLSAFSTDSEQVFTINAEFGINFPKYLRTGDYLLAWGMINDPEGDPIKGFIAQTTIRDLDFNIVLGPISWNCSNGNYQAAFATNTLEPGKYEIVVKFRNSTNVEFTYTSRLYLATDPDEGIYVDAHVYYTFYDISTGTGLDDNFYKVYISKDQNFSAGDRVKGGEIGILKQSGDSIVTNGRYYIQIRDFNDNIIPFSEYNDELITPYDESTISNAYAGFTVNSPEFYIDLGVYLNQLRIKNMNSSTVYIILQRTDGKPGQVLGRFIPPWEETEVFIPEGRYNLTIQYYDNDHPGYGPTKTTYPWDRTNDGSSIKIDTDLFYWIQGYRLEDVIDTVKESGTWLYYTFFDMNTGSQLKDDFYKIYISEDTYFDEDDRIKGGKYKTSIGDTLHIKVKDYWNNVIYPYNGSSYDNITILDEKTYIDVGIPLNQFLIKNTNNTLVYFKMTDGNFSDPVNNTWYNRWVAPGESTELFVRSSNYNISMEYYYPNNATFIKFENITNYQILQDLFFVIRGYNARVYLNYYNSEQGLGLPFEVLKTYINGIRTPTNSLETYMGSSVNIKVKDYYDDIMLNQNFTISGVLNYIDLELTTLSYKFSNYKDDFFVIGFKKKNASIWWEKIVCPYETIEFLVPPGNYSVRVYNNTFSLAEFNTTVNSSKAFTIKGPDLNASIYQAIEGQQRIIQEIRATNESYNYTNSMIFDVLGKYYYSNQTIQSILNNFRQPHIWQIPTINYTVNDTNAPISSITAVITIDGSIRVKWHSADDSSQTVDFTTLYYKVNNASWKEWYPSLESSGSKYFNKSTESFSEGDTCHFRVLGTDTKGNVEKASEINTCSILYRKYTPPSTPDPYNILKDITTNWTFILIIIAIIGLSVFVVILEGRKRKRDKKKEEYEEKARSYLPEANYYSENTNMEPVPGPYGEGANNPYDGGPYY